MAIKHTGAEHGLVGPVYVQDKAGEIREVFEPQSFLPAFVLETLEMGTLAVYDGRIYGLSPAHILGED
jgi:hypothetical protein